MDGGEDHDMKFSITSGGAEVISKFCVDDPVAVRKWNLVKLSFVKNNSKRIKIELELEKCNHELAILETFEAWISAIGIAATMASCIEILRKYELNKLVDELGKRRHEIRTACKQNNGSYSGLGIPFGLSDIVYNFTGRKKELEELHELITKEPTTNLESCCYTLLTSVYGLGGIGKTTLARKYILEYGSSYFNNNIYWIEAESRDTLCRSFLKLARTLKIACGENLEIDEVVKKVYVELANQKCLFVFDNVEDYHGPNGIRAFLPDGVLKKPYLLMTSRNSGLVQNERVLRLDVLSEQDALDLMKKMLPQANKKSCAQLFARMSGFPLALQLSLACIKNSERRYKDQSDATLAYLEGYDKNAVELHNSQIILNDGYKQTIYLTWKSAMDKIKGQPYGRLAELVLCLMAYLYPDNIQYEFLFKLAQRDRDIRPLPCWYTMVKLFFTLKDRQPSNITMDNLLEAVESLDKYSITSLSSEKGIIKIHRLVQDVVRLTTMSGELMEYNIVKNIVGNIHRELSEQGFNDQCILHGNTILPYYEKYRKCQTLYPKLLQMVSSQWMHVDMIIDTLKCSDQDAIRLFKVIRVAYNLIVDTARTSNFIKYLDEVSNPIDLYILTFEELSNNYPSFKLIQEQNLEFGHLIRDLSILLYQIKNPLEKLTLKLLFEYIFLCRNHPRHKHMSVITKLKKDGQELNQQLQTAISTLEKFGFVQTTSNGRKILAQSHEYSHLRKRDLKLLEQLDDFSSISYNISSLESSTHKVLAVLQLLVGIARITFAHFFNHFRNGEPALAVNAMFDAVEDLARACIICNLSSIHEYLKVYQKYLLELKERNDVTHSTRNFQNIILLSMELLKILAVMDCRHFSIRFLMELGLGTGANFKTIIRMLELFGFIIKSCPYGCNNYSMDPIIQVTIANEYFAERSRSVASIIRALAKIQTLKLENSVTMCKYCWNKTNNMLLVYLRVHLGPVQEERQAVDLPRHMSLTCEALFHATTAANQLKSGDGQLKALNGAISYFLPIVQSLCVK